MSHASNSKSWIAGCVAAALTLAGCGGGLDELRAEIEQAKLRPGGRITPLPEVVPYESLEQFPLDTLKMVGTLRLGRSNYGLVQTQDGLIHRVLPGNHLGQNDGRITSVNDAQVAVVEIVPDGMGGYIERQAALALSD